MRRKKQLKAPSIGQRIRDIRGSRTLEQFGKLLDIKNPTVYRYETDRIPDADMLMAIAALDPLKRGVEWLLTGEVSSLYKEGAGGEGRVVEPAEPYQPDPRRRKLIDEIKKFAAGADDDLIDALLKNIKAFKELQERRQVLKEK